MLGAHRTFSYIQEFPSVQTTSSSVDVVRVPRENGPEDLRVELKSCRERRGIMKPQVGTEPINYSRLAHFLFHN